MTTANNQALIANDIIKHSAAVASFEEQQQDSTLSQDPLAAVSGPSATETATDPFAIYISEFDESAEAAIHDVCTENCFDLNVSDDSPGVSSSTYEAIDRNLVIGYCDEDDDGCRHCMRRNA